jgi:hypothetical protein
MIFIDIGSVLILIDHSFFLLFAGLLKTLRMLYTSQVLSQQQVQKMKMRLYNLP